MAVTRMTITRTRAGSPDLDPVAIAPMIRLRARAGRGAPRARRLSGPPV